MSLNYEDITISEAKELLKKWREGNERRSEDVMELWTTVLSKDLNKLGNEKYLVTEQVITAALDCHSYAVAIHCIANLFQAFPKSLRVLTHEAANREAQEDYEEALKTLSCVNGLDPTDSLNYKRRVAILKAQGNIPDAIQSLVDYLKKFVSDVEAWQELCNLYLSTGELARALFCAEELLLHQPHHHLLHQMAADIRYTMGGVENLELAKTYYCQALKLNPDNMRALLGLFLCTNSLLSQYKSGGSGGKRAEAWRLRQWAQSAVSAKQTEQCSLTNMMLSLAIAE